MTTESFGCALKIGTGYAIFYHQSQKDGVMFQGDDNREFWVRVEDRNRLTAKRYNDLGLADYAAIEAFKRYHF